MTLGNIKETIEDKVIDYINSGASGRLIIFKPENSDKDLVVEKKGDYEKKVICLKIFGKEFLGNDSIKKEIKPEENFYLLFVDFDIVKQDLKDNFVIVSSMDFSQNSIDKKDFSMFLIEKFEKK